MSYQEHCGNCNCFITNPEDKTPCESCEKIFCDDCAKDTEGGVLCTDCREEQQNKCSTCIYFKCDEHYTNLGVCQNDDGLPGQTVGVGSCFTCHHVEIPT